MAENEKNGGEAQGLDATGTKVELMIPNTEALGKLSGMEPGYSRVAKYRKQEEWAELKGKPQRAYYLGIKQIPNEDGEEINCAIFAGEKETFLAAQMVILDAVRPLEVQTAVEITFLEKKKNKSTKGSTNLFEVKVLQ
jgi:hypothetical protein